ncbi:MAG: FAD-binding oxidoreductase [Acidobacteriota bacterium]|nr:FAD-binding oxidoreductase [Acidobacteriota bacterium]
MPHLDPHAATYSDASGYTGWCDRVLRPATEDEVIAIVRDAVATHTPLTIAGAATGLTGSGVPQGGWLVSMERFRTLQIEQGYARVGPAVSLLELRDRAAATGQFYAPDPTEIRASLGGGIATNASGSRSFRFGPTRRHLRALRVVTMDGLVRSYRRGEPIAFAVPTLPQPATTKNTAGFRLTAGMDWVDLFCGSEGTLGIVIEAEVTLLPIPDEVVAGVIFFSSDDAALDAVAAWRELPQLRMLEYADHASLRMIGAQYPEIAGEARAALLIEAEGHDLEDWKTRVAAAGALVEATWIALGSHGHERFRAFRHALPNAVIDTMRQRGFLNMGTDYAVPIGRNREMLRHYRERLETELPGRYVVYGHIGDAHLHVNMLPASEDDARTATRLLREFAQRAVELGGTVSAEHGLGKRKASLLALQFTPAEIDAMRAVKQRLDPHWLLGRGTLFASPGQETV